MTRRQRVPEQWLIADERLGGELWRTVQRLPPGSGVILLRELRPGEQRRLRHVAALRRLVIVHHASAARVHNVRELRTALLRRARLILVSPMHETRSHPDWAPLPLMRAAALARLAGRNAIALGGMSRRRYAKIAALGFTGWAGIDAFRT
jgi:thiamine-phosphate pyrophosphorylase